MLSGLFTGIRNVGYLTFLFLVLPPAIAVAFLGVQIVVFGFLLGAAFAPNHIGLRNRDQYTCPLVRQYRG